LQRGLYLGQCLDQLLEPLGYRWRVRRRVLEAGEIAEVAVGQLTPNANRRYFEFFKKGSSGTVVTVDHQRYGATLNAGGERTNVEVSGVQFNTAGLANDVMVRGGFGEYEITVELLRSWPTADDPAAGVGDEYDKEHADFDDVRNVMRKWVLNEAGDYIALRAEIDGIFTSTLRSSLNSLGILNHFIARRREFIPTLTLSDDGEPIGKTRGVEIEWSNDGGSTWNPTENMTCQLLEHECGVYFDGPKLPEEFLTDPADTRVRVTATIQSDYRLSGYAPRLGTSPQDDVVPLVLDLPDRFRYRLRHSSLSKYGGGATPSLAVNDSTGIQDFAEYSRDVWDLMDVGGAIQLEGLDNGYDVGMRVSGIQYKNVSFEARAGSGEYPQIVAIERNVNQQVTTLHLERQRDPLATPRLPRQQRRAFA
jgi:hypothetical protein